MAKVLLLYYSQVNEIMYDAMSEELLKNGNDVMRFNIKTNILYNSWGAELHLINKDVLVDILNFNPEVMLNFNNSAPLEVIETVSEKCKICILDADNPEFFWNKNLLNKYNKECFYYLGMQSCSLNLYQRFISKKILAEKNYLFFPLATSIKKEELVQNKNITFIGTNFFPQDNPLDLPKGFYEEKTLKLYRKIKEDYYLSFSKAAEILGKGYSDIDVERLFNVVKHYYVGQDRLKYLSILAPLGLTIYGLNCCWPRCAYYDFDIAASFDNTPISTLKDNQRVYNTSKISVNISHPQAKSSFSWRVMDIMASASCLLMEKKSDWDELFGKDISKNVKDTIIYSDRIDMYLKAKRLLEDEGLRKQCVSELNNAIEKNGRWKQRFEMLEKFLSVKLIGLNNKTPSYITIAKDQSVDLFINNKNMSQKSERNKITMNRKNITRFFKSILYVRSEGIHKVVGICGIKISFRSKYKELLNILQQQQQQQQQQQLQTIGSLLQQVLFYFEKKGE